MTVILQENKQPQKNPQCDVQSRRADLWESNVLFHFLCIYCTDLREWNVGEERRIETVVEVLQD